MNPATLDQLQALRLTGMLQAWQAQHTSSTYHDLSFEDRFALLVEHVRVSVPEGYITAARNNDCIVGSNKLT